MYTHLAMLPTYMPVSMAAIANNWVVEFHKVTNNKSIFVTILLHPELTGEGSITDVAAVASSCARRTFSISRRHSSVHKSDSVD